MRPDSISSVEEWPEPGGEFDGAMSKAVGNATGRGAGGLVTDIVGNAGTSSFEELA